MNDQVTRRALLQRLVREGPDTATRLVEQFAMSRQAVVKHLQVLADAGLVAPERDGREVRYRATPDRLRDAVTWLLDTGANSYVVDAIIGFSVVYKAFENLGGFRKIGIAINTKLAVFGFGLFHGLGLATKVRDLQVGSGLNAATGEYGDLVKAGVIDPVKVTRSALRNAASIASMVLTTDTLVVEKKEEEPEAAGGHGHGHGH